MEHLHLLKTEIARNVMKAMIEHGKLDPSHKSMIEYREIIGIAHELSVKMDIPITNEVVFDVISNARDLTSQWGDNYYNDESFLLVKTSHPSRFVVNHPEKSGWKMVVEKVAGMNVVLGMVPTVEDAATLNKINSELTDEQRETAKYYKLKVIV